MANTLKPKRSSVAGNIPTTTNLASGELAVNMADQKVWINNGTSVVQVGSGKLSGLADVVLSSLASGQGLSWNGTNWVNSSAGSGTVTSVSGTGTVSGLTLTGSVTGSGSLTLGGTLSLTSGQVTTALGFTPYNATNPSGYITSGGSISGNAATATALQTARTINGISFNGSANIKTSEWVHSDRDFASGTLVTTDINYAVTNGDPFVLEIRGNSYGDAVPYDIQYQGYIYSDTIINHGGYSNGTNITGLVAINVGGNLCFWWPRQSYWNGFNVRVYTAYATVAVNRVTSITSTAKPTSTKEVALSANIRQSLHSGNYNSYTMPLSGGATWSMSYFDFSQSAVSFRINSGPGTFNIGDDDIVNLANGAAIATPSSRVTSGVAFLSTYGYGSGQGDNKTHFGYYNGSSYVNYIRGAATYFDSGTVQIGGNQALHAGNYNSYSPTLTGGNASGTWGINITGNAATVSGFKSFGQIAINPNGANANCTTAQFIAHLTSIGMFNYAYSVAKCSWDYAGNNDLTDTGFGTIDMAGCVIETWINNSEKHIRITRPTTGAGGFQVLIYNDQGSGYSPGWRAMMTSENIGSQSVNYANSAGSVTGGLKTVNGNSLIGSGDISVSVSGLTLTSSANGINPDSVTQNQIGYNTSVSLFGQTDGGLYSSAHSSSWIHQIYGDFRTGQIAVRGKNSGTWQAWRTVLDSSNYTSYSPSLTGTGASGTWAISVTGTAVALSSSNYINRTGSSGNLNTDFSNTPAGTQRYQGDDSNLTNSPGGTWWIYEHKRHSNASNVWGTQVAWGWEDNSNRLMQRNVSGNSWSGWVEYLNTSGRTFAGSLTMSGDITGSSDERLKTNWQDMPQNYVARLAEVKVGIYDRLDEENLTQVGVSAQSFQKLLPQAVMTAKDEMGTLSVSYGNAALASAVELAKDNVDLRARVAKLEALVSKLIEG